MSDTPMTDTATFRGHMANGVTECGLMVWASFASDLERQLAESEHKRRMTDDHGKDLCTKVTALRQQLAEARAENKRLNHDIISTSGLYCIDRDPKDVDIEWIRRNAFQLRENK